MASPSLLARNPPVHRSLASGPQWLKDLISPNPSLLGEETRQTIKAAMLQGALDSLQLPCSSSSACGEGQSPTRVTSDPPTLHIKASSCLPGTASPVWWQKPFSRGSWEGLWFLGVTGKIHLAHRTRRRRSIGSSSSSKRDRGLGACSPRHPDVPLSTGLPTGWADSDPVREKRQNLLGLPASSAASSLAFSVCFQALGSPKTATAFPRLPSSFPNPISKPS